MIGFCKKERDVEDLEGWSWRNGGHEGCGPTETGTGRDGDQEG